MTLKMSSDAEAGRRTTEGSWRAWLAAGVLIVAFFCQCFFASRIKSPTFDEPAHLAAGLSYVQTLTFGANPQHPPLLKELSALPLFLAGVRLPDTARARDMVAGKPGLEYPVGFDIIESNGPDRVMFWARLPLILLATALGALLYWWGREIVGEPAALGALLLYAFSPTVIAHASLVTTDVGFAAFGVLFLFALWRYLQRPGLVRLILCGAALGAVLVTKYSALILWPIGAVLLLAAHRWPLTSVAGRGAPGMSSPRLRPTDPCHCGSGKKYKWCHGAAEASPGRGRRGGGSAGVRAAEWSRSLLRWVGALAVMSVAAIVVVELFYFFPADPLLYVAGAARVNADHDPNYLVFMGGQLAPQFSSYFLVTYLLKESLPSLVLFTAGLVVLARHRTMGTLPKLVLTLPVLAMFVEYTVFAAGLGVRYLIPLLPFVYLIAGLGLAALLRTASVWTRGAGVVLCAWQIVAAVGIYPDHLAYFNEMACASTPSTIGLDGGTRCGPSWLDDHNVDWGQGLKQLKTWLDQHAGGRPIRFVYFGLLPPDAYGIRGAIDPSEVMTQGNPDPGLYVISAHFLARLPPLGDRVDPGAGRWMTTTPPTAIVGHSLYVYDIPPAPGAPVPRPD